MAVVVRVEVCRGESEESEQSEQSDIDASPWLTEKAAAAGRYRLCHSALR